MWSGQVLAVQGENLNRIATNLGRAPMNAAIVRGSLDAEGMSRKTIQMRMGEAFQASRKLGDDLRQLFELYATAVEILIGQAGERFRARPRVPTLGGPS